MTENTSMLRLAAERLADRAQDRMQELRSRPAPKPQKVYAFNPPTHQPKHDSLADYGMSKFHEARGDYKPLTHTGAIGLGSYYASLGMRDSDVDKRMQKQNITGKGYLLTKASYNVHKGRKGEE